MAKSIVSEKALVMMMGQSFNNRPYQHQVAFPAAKIKNIKGETCSTSLVRNTFIICGVVAIAVKLPAKIPINNCFSITSINSLKNVLFGSSIL